MSQCLLTPMWHTKRRKLFFWGLYIIIFCEESLRIQNFHLSKSEIFDITRYETVHISLNSGEVLKGILKIIRLQI